MAKRTKKHAAREYARFLSLVADGTLAGLSDEAGIRAGAGEAARWIRQAERAIRRTQITLGRHDCDDCISAWHSLDRLLEPAVSEEGV